MSAAKSESQIVKSGDSLLILSRQHWDFRTLNYFRFPELAPPLLGNSKTKLFRIRGPVAENHAAAAGGKIDPAIEARVAVTWLIPPYWCWSSLIRTQLSPALSERKSA